MNIKNEKISARQAGCMFFCNFFAVPVLLLPQQLAQNDGMDGFFALVGGGLLGYLFLQLVLLVTVRMEGDYRELLRQHFGSWVTCPVMILYLVTAVSAAAYSLQLLCRVVRVYLIRDTPVWLILGALLLLAFYGLCMGTEGAGRRCELLFWFVTVPLFVVILVAVWNIEPDHWLPVAQIGGRRFLAGSYLVFAYTLPAVWLPMYAPRISGREDLRIRVTRGYLLSVILQMILFLTLTGIYGAPTVAVMDEAILELAAMVKTPGGFLERQDALMCSIWLIAMYVFAEQACYAAVWSMEHIGNGRKKHWFRVACGVLVYAAALLLYRHRDLEHVLSKVYLTAAVPALVLVIAAVSARRLSKPEGRDPKWQKK